MEATDIFSFLIAYDFFHWFCILLESASLLVSWVGTGSPTLSGQHISVIARTLCQGSLQSMEENVRDRQLL